MTPVWFLRNTVFLLAASALLGCLPDEKGNDAVNAKRYELNRLGSDTFFVDQHSGQVFQLSDGRLLEIQKLDEAAQQRNRGVKWYAPPAAQGMVFWVGVKYDDGRMHFRIETEGQQQGQKAYDDPFKASAGQPRELSDEEVFGPQAAQAAGPQARANFFDQFDTAPASLVKPDWAQAWDNPDNRLMFTFRDRDGFSLSALSLRLKGEEFGVKITQTVDQDGKRMGYLMEGSVALPARDFEQITRVEVSWKFNSTTAPFVPRRR